MSKHTVLFELGCEELPPKSLKTLRDALQAETVKGLKDAGLAFDSIEAYAAPRRLALKIVNVDGAQADTQKRFDGPAVQAAYDAEGKPTKALEGFMRGQGISIDQVSTFQAGKVEKVCYLKDVKGQSLDVLLPQILQTALDHLPVAKRMRSAASRTEFVRPVKWVVLLKDDQVIEATIQDHTAANVTYGHRFHAPDAITLANADAYLDALRAAKVVASFEERQAIIDQQVKALADEVNAIAIVPADLRDEVTSLVEWPVALRASFEERFLAVPQEALITTMQDNQKYFCLVNSDHKLQPYFITVSNIESKAPKQIIEGNEKVVRPRLSDAEFFFLQDQKQPLASRSEKLANMVFQAQLGTLWDKTVRIAMLAVELTKFTGAQVADAERAAMLSKCDLTSELVGEFPELQGIAGTYYARLEGENDEVAEALGEQYLPKFAGDVLPKTKTGTTIALADRLDTLVGIFGIGQAPTGSKDPFALRRSAIGILRLIIENNLNVTIEALVNSALHAYGALITDPNKTRSVAVAFLEGRYRAKYEDQGVQVDVIQAVQAMSPASPLDFDKRVNAVNHFRNLPEAAALAAANKRVANILAKEAAPEGSVVEANLVEDAEKALFAELAKITPVVEPLFAAKDYTAALSALAALRVPVDAFFDGVMVMADDAELKANRLRMLAQLRDLFTKVADISVLQH
ncbi:glycine--tRNA ligase subunit beta [Acinetobacter radioresistens]|uniref:Glycine--tRNA ligase beta subunit n=2 Tax=Acinetobacter radioresistens TaxID=40216 RepID=A0ABM9YMX5_ACIRA|nr:MULTISPECIES: glycine--tRNA ligase subunit beta [Acinetobacter]EET82383.1 glycine--tRNA ligase, beta subunit [Acinetobacter radioresistens SK82]EEY85744.1 glycine--tRNA ligase, beta subunit [Acinetobacter radioresistens SH164]ENV85711.1 glycyl-tRNA synthetase beta subunit [Acinetobacter radioresistens NIPH 2130]EXB87765.1 glycine--tRNA ligase, beta subunit [Acinetobacter sp. 272263]EXE59825.1 glycine--tRNA ligase, beta subunit [Acinetobacter sp. 1239920]